MPTALAVRHVHIEDLGVIEPILRARGYAIEYLDVWLEAVVPERLEEPDLLVVLGGPIGVYQEDTYPFLTDELAGIAARLSRRSPTLGVCLGAQLMARALGAQVRSTGLAEIGYAPLTLTTAGRDSVLAPLDGQPVLHWHGDRFEIPDGATHLASTPTCAHQAFSMENWALGLQFHLEADPDRIEGWLIAHAHELASNGIDPQEIREDASRVGPGLASAGRQVLTEWLDRAGL